MGIERPTAAILDETRDLDRRSVEEILALIHAQDRVAVDAVGRVLPEISQAVDVLVCALSGGGRWYNVGAGTSGRMGALDAAEIPPTFGLPSHRVQAVIAGGEEALSRAVEEAEDDPEAARRQLRVAGLRPGDVVVAISASGRTPSRWRLSKSLTRWARARSRSRAIPIPTSRRAPRSRSSRRWAPR